MWKFSAFKNIYLVQKKCAFTYRVMVVIINNDISYKDREWKDVFQNESFISSGTWGTKSVSQKSVSKPLLIASGAERGGGEKFSHFPQFDQTSDFFLKFFF